MKSDMWVVHPRQANNLESDSTNSKKKWQKLYVPVTNPDEKLRGGILHRAPGLLEYNTLSK